MKLRRSQAQVSNAPRQRQMPADEAKPTTYAYRARRSDEGLNTGRLTQRAAALQAAPGRLRRLLLKRFGLVCLLAAMLFSCITLLSLSSEPRILPLSNSQSAFLQDKSTYQQVAQDLLTNSPWDHNKLTVNTERLNQRLLDRFPELYSANTTVPLFSKRPIIYLQAAEPVLILTTRDGSYVVDNRGKALLSADKLSDTVRGRLPIVTDRSGLRVALHAQALSGNDTRFIQILLAQLAAKKLTIASMILPQASSELDVTLVGQSYSVKFNLQNGDARRQAGTFLATQAHLQTQHITPTSYIDVRVPGRAYYR